ncbi:hypothetical protein [Lamprobacter modestohalophilus]|uniref:hypothetical protein n=1 Tax=Lamprobacter modestohalophilus TaxID=1064514 RepID=UPI0019074F74|nr:hypothetical protein [Lamprobacter modestohalophilus]
MSEVFGYTNSAGGAVSHWLFVTDVGDHTSLESILGRHPWRDIRFPHTANALSSKFFKHFDEENESACRHAGQFVFDATWAEKRDRRE